MSYNKSKNSGFTIVELLVVIVVIGILAAITIVSYTGVTTRARASAAQQLANNVVKKANTYQTEGSTLNWPLTGALAISATNSSSALSGVTIKTSAVTSSDNAGTISYQLCGTTSSTTVTTAPANLAAITNPTGVLVGYWDGGIATPAQVTISAGTVSGTSPYVHTTGTAYNNSVACYYTAS